MKPPLRYTLLALTIALAFAALWQVQRVAKQLRESEEQKVRLWAGAIAQRNQLAEATRQFFHDATLDEHRKMQLYTDILQSLGDPDMDADLGFSLRYVNYIVDSNRTPIIITTAHDSMITVPRELAGHKLEGALLDEFSHNPPFTYNVWGMRMTLYYKESEYYTRLRQVLEGYTESFLADITQNSVMVPVVIVDSTRRNVLAYGNIDSTSIRHFDFNNDPIEVMLPTGQRSYVYYTSTPMLRALRWVPLLYLLIAVVLVIVGYSLFQTTRRAEQNRIWAGLAKETAHQLGTPLSSLSGWAEYLKGRELTPQYSAEIEKDLQRLDTIARRFSKIGSSPELKDEDVRQATLAAVDYLKGRTSRHVQFVTQFPENETFVAPLNSHLFQWVIENLCKNAVDALERSEKDGAEHQAPGAEPKAKQVTIAASQDARRIYLDVIDNGRGMAPAVARRIFDSGFTTKKRGWGLGLPLAKRIIEQYHRGRLRLKYSIPGEGTCFRIVLRKNR